MTFPPPTTADSLLLDEANACLRSALHLPASDPKLAHWLFANRTHPFHLDAPLVPPSAFSNALAIRMSHQFTACSTVHPLSARFPGRALDGQLRSPHVPSSDVTMLFVAVAETGGCVRGYVIASGVPFGGLVDRLEGHRFRGRFLFDRARRRLVSVMHALSPTVTVVFSMTWRDSRWRERHFFAVPNAEYTYNHLPTRVLAILKNLEFKMEDAQQVFGFAHEANAAAAAAAAVASHAAEVWAGGAGGVEVGGEASSTTTRSSRGEGKRMEEQSATDVLRVDPGTSWPDASLEGLDDFIAGPLSPGPGFSSASPPPHLDVTHSFDTSPVPLSPTPSSLLLAPNGSTATMPSQRAMSEASASNFDASPKPPPPSPFNLSPLAEALGSMERMLGGEFFGPRLSRDILHPFTGEVTSRVTGELRASVLGADPHTQRSLQQLAAHSYYAAALDVPGRVMLSRPSLPRVSVQHHHHHREQNNNMRQGRRGECEASEMESRSGETGEMGRELATIAPMPMRCSTRQLAVAEPAVGEGQEQGPKQGREMGEEAIKEAKREAKRRKNRLSAARSNQKRKERVESQKRELVELRERVKVLKGKRESLAEENRELKARGAAGK